MTKKVRGFSDSEIRRFVKSYRKFGKTKSRYGYIPYNLECKVNLAGSECCIEEYVYKYYVTGHCSTCITSDRSIVIHYICLHVHVYIHVHV